MKKLVLILFIFIVTSCTTRQENAIGASSVDLTAILEALKNSGAIRAYLIII
jgi:flagellar basal body P-ring protein FlgI